MVCYGAENKSVFVLFCFFMVAVQLILIILKNDKLRYLEWEIQGTQLKYVSEGEDQNKMAAVCVSRSG